jgi:RNA polymerase sigma-70 factor (ECF subfamily)
MPWLATVARRPVVDGHRRRTARPREVGEAPLRRVAVPDPSDDLLRTVVVAEALRSLSAPHREVLVETLLRDHTVSHAAEVLGIPVGTAKSRIFHGMRALRQVLEEMGVRTP